MSKNPSSANKQNNHIPFPPRLSGEPSSSTNDSLEEVYTATQNKTLANSLVSELLSENGIVEKYYERYAQHQKDSEPFDFVPFAAEIAEFIDAKVAPDLALGQENSKTREEQIRGLVDAILAESPNMLSDAFADAYKRRNDGASKARNIISSILLPIALVGVSLCIAVTALAWFNGHAQHSAAVARFEHERAAEYAPINNWINEVKNHMRKRDWLFYDFTRNSGTERVIGHRASHGGLEGVERAFKVNPLYSPAAPLFFVAEAMKKVAPYIGTAAAAAGLSGLAKYVLDTWNKDHGDLGAPALKHAKEQSLNFAQQFTNNVEKILGQFQKPALSLIENTEVIEMILNVLSDSPAKRIESIMETVGLKSGKELSRAELGKVKAVYELLHKSTVEDKGALKTEFMQRVVDLQLMGVKNPSIKDKLKEGIKAAAIDLAGTIPSFALPGAIFHTLFKVIVPQIGGEAAALAGEFIPAPVKLGLAAIASIFCLGKAGFVMATAMRKMSDKSKEHVIKECALLTNELPAEMQKEFAEDLCKAGLAIYKGDPDTVKRLIKSHIAEGEITKAVDVVQPRVTSFEFTRWLRGMVPEFRIRRQMRS